MPLGSIGQGPGYTHFEGDKTTDVSADKYFSKISMYGSTVCSIQVRFNDGGTATAAGVLYVQGSNENNPTDLAAGSNEWETLDVAFNRAVTAGAGMASINLSNVGWRWLRVFYDRTSGSGPLQVATVIKVQ